MARDRSLSRYGLLWVLIAMVSLLAEGKSTALGQDIHLVVDTSHSLGPIDLTQYGLGQGGLSDEPMITDRVDQIAQLHPQTIHIFLQEYFDIYPAHHQYHWEKFDETTEAIRATGAAPIVSLVFKPKVLFPKVDQNNVTPNSWPEWEDVIYHLVKHTEDRKFGVKYWILTNEGDIGEPGGVPFKFPTDESYLVYYKHTASAILRADPKAKVGGPAPANFHSSQIDALIAAAGTGKVPFDLLSFHTYSNDPEKYRQIIVAMQAKLAKYPSLNHVQTYIDQWNMSPVNSKMNPYFQPAFVLETTRVFYQSGLDGAAFFHIRDYFVNEKQFTSILSPAGIAFMEHWWNVMPQTEGIYDNQDRVRPDYYAFKLLSLIKGQHLPVTGTESDIHAFSARDGHWVNTVIWNFPHTTDGKPHTITIQFPFEKNGFVRVARLNAEAAINNLEMVHVERVQDIATHSMQITLRPYEIYWVEITD